jgi:hypothetical protein
MPRPELRLHELPYELLGKIFAGSGRGGAWARTCRTFRDVAKMYPRNESQVDRRRLTEVVCIACKRRRTDSWLPPCACFCADPVPDDGDDGNDSTTSDYEECGVCDARVCEYCKHECSKCNLIVCDRDMSSVCKCNRCDQIFCDEHPMVQCPGCEEMACEDCCDDYNRECGVCDKQPCKECMSRCTGRCGKLACAACLDAHGRCKQCRKKPRMSSSAL